MERMNDEKLLLQGRSVSKGQIRGGIVMQRFSPSTATSGSRARPTANGREVTASESMRTARATLSTPLTGISSQY